MVFIIAAAILFLDQLSKFIITKSLQLHQSIPVIKGFFYLTLVNNQGAAFGLFKNQLILLIVTSVGAIGLICYNLKAGADKRASSDLALGLILAGAAGNLIDRIFFGHVIDFLDFRIWPVFNIADSSITIGACILGWLLIFKKDKRKEA
jgi:signal peptidase II